MEQTTNSAKAKQELFSVPKGYFNNLTPAVMQKIDAQNEPKALPKRKFLLLRPVYMVAASVLVAIGGLAVYMDVFNNGPSPTTPSMSTSAATNIAGTYKDAVADYAMMDNEDIYVHYSEI
jgi:hypothetical protein